MGRSNDSNATASLDVLVVLFLCLTPTTTNEAVINIYAWKPQQSVLYQKCFYKDPGLSPISEDVQCLVLNSNVTV